MTAKSILNSPREELLEKTDLEESTIDDVLEILRREYEDEDDNAQEETPADDNSEAKS